MRTMVLVALALTDVAFSAWKESPDPDTAAGAYSSYGAPIELGKGKARHTWYGTRRTATRSRWEWR